jgi:uncharacterized membrane protein
MKISHFLNKVEHARVHQAIKAAEERTSGDIVVFISHRAVNDPVAGADRQFLRLKLETATDKNSLLIFLAPKTQKFAVVGGTALHEKVGQKWWDELVALIGGHFKDGRYTDGLVAAIEEAGRVLRQHFPATDTDRTGQKDIVEE